MKKLLIFFPLISAFLFAKEHDSKDLQKIFAVPSTIPFPSSNPYSRKKELLGLKLFFSRLTDQKKSFSCANCHNPFKGFEDEFTFSLGSGGKRTTRNSPTIMNLAWSNHFFWDGRVKSLEEQVVFPIESPLELNLKMNDLKKRLLAEHEYVRLFQEAFPQKGITKETIAMALATFIRTLISNESPFDKWIKGDPLAITESAKRGFDLFRGKGKCISCHSGWRFSNDQFYDVGMKSTDLGRGYLNPTFNYSFKVPGLRKISERAPYMHDGSLVTLDEVIDFFNRGGDVKRSSLKISPLGLSIQEKRDLKEFLLSLNEKEIKTEILQELSSAKEYWGKKRLYEYGY